MENLLKFIILVSLVGILITSNQSDGVGTIRVNATAINIEDSVFNLILFDVADHEYIPNVYDCTEFSEHLERRLGDYGWDAEQIMVVVNCSSPSFIDGYCEQWNGRHDIVYVKDIYIEATTGEVIPPGLYYDYGIE